MDLRALSGLRLSTTPGIGYLSRCVRMNPSVLSGLRLNMIGPKMLMIQIVRMDPRALRGNSFLKLVPIE